MRYMPRMAGLVCKSVCVSRFPVPPRGQQVGQSTHSGNIKRGWMELHAQVPPTSEPNWHLQGARKNKTQKNIIAMSLKAKLSLQLQVTKVVKGLLAVSDCVAIC